jgi:formamidopyrimidine-DNA glycosylase
MPELPEVETVARDLRNELVGRRFISAWVSQPGVLRYPDAESFCAALPGRAVLSVDGRELRFDDARRFGRVMLGSTAVLGERRVLPALGVEPLSDDFTAERLDGLMRRTTRTVKAALLDQSGIAGLGNIYVDEACHLAGVRPTRRANRLTRRERTALHAAIRSVLTKAITNRGTTIDDYRDLWDARGSHQEELQVYGRGGEQCRSCGTVLRRAVVAGRGTVYCPRCQR